MQTNIMLRKEFKLRGSRAPPLAPRGAQVAAGLALGPQVAHAECKARGAGGSGTLSRTCRTSGPLDGGFKVCIPGPSSPHLGPSPVCLIFCGNLGLTEAPWCYIITQ